MKTFDPPQTNMATKTPGPPSRKTPDHMSKQKMMWQTLPGRNAHTAPIETRRPGWHNTNSKMQRNILFLQNIKLVQHFTYPKQTIYYTLRMHKDPSPERPFQILDTIVYEMIKQKMLWYILHTHCNSLLKLKLWNKCSLWSLRETQDSMLLHIFISHKCRLQVHTVNKPTRFIIRLLFGFASDLYLSDYLFVKLNKNINK